MFSANPSGVLVVTAQKVSKPLAHSLAFLGDPRNNSLKNVSPGKETSETQVPTELLNLSFNIVFSLTLHQPRGFRCHQLAKNDCTYSRIIARCRAVPMEDLSDDRALN